MPAITKSWTDIADTAVDPDSPITTGLMTALRDNAINVREWLGAGFVAGAVQDHNHDGVNSARVPIGPNLLRNGSFEDGEAGWTFVDFTGGSHAVSTAQRKDGAQSMAFTSTVLANGGAEGITDEFINVSEGLTYSFIFLVGASVANVSSKFEVVWYDAAKSQISTTVLYNVTSTPTALTLRITATTPPTNARWGRIRITGPVPGSGSATGTVYWDGIQMGASVIGNSAQILSGVVVQSHIASAAVGQAQLKTTTAAGGVGVAVDGVATYSLAGGTYSWWTASGSIATGPLSTFAFGNSDTSAGVIGITRIGGDITRNFNVDERYVQASPPYDLGDGEIPVFVWLWVASDGSIRGVQVAPDPPWAYHGPTDIRPEYERGGKAYRRVAMVEGRELAEARADRALLARIIAGTARIETIEREIDQAYKHRDMGLWPHPFVGNDLAGSTIILVDPVSTVVERLRLLQDGEGARAVADLITKGWLEIDNQPLARRLPPGVQAVSARLK